MAIDIALLGFNDLGRTVTPIFLFRNRFYLQLSTHCPKMNKKSMWEVKKIRRFLFMGHRILPSCGCEARESVAAKCELVLYGTSPVDKIRLIGPFNNILLLWPSSLTKPDLLRFRCSPGHILSKTKSVTPAFFTFLTSLTHYLSMVKFSEKINVRKFSRERP